MQPNVTIDDKTINAAAKGLGSLYKIIFGAFFGVIGIIFLVVLISKISKALKKDDTKDYEKEVDKKDLTFTEAEYKSFADILFQAFDGWGTTEENVYRVLRKMKTKSDWYKLIDTYGIDKDNEMTLVERLVDEMDSSEISEVNSILQAIDSSLTL